MTYLEQHLDKIFMWFIDQACPPSEITRSRDDLRNYSRGLAKLLEELTLLCGAGLSWITHDISKFWLDTWNFCRFCSTAKIWNFIGSLIARFVIWLAHIWPAKVMLHLPNIFVAMFLLLSIQHGIMREGRGSVCFSKWWLQSFATYIIYIATFWKVISLTIRIWSPVIRRSWNISMMVPSTETWLLKP